MISQEYLAKLDAIGLSRGYEYDTEESLLEELRYEWIWLKEYWKFSVPTAVGSFIYHPNQRLGCLTNLAEVGYELLARLTHQEWDSIISAAKELHVKKNAGYSPEDTDAWANFRECTHFGISAADGCLVRLCDKYRRFFNVYTNPENDQVAESAIDTLRDFAAYCLILVCLLEETNNG